MAYQLNAIESYKDRVSKKGKKYLSVKVMGRGWASCWDSKLWPILKKAAQNGTEINIDISESENVDENGNPYLNVMGAVDPAGESGAEDGTEGEGEEGAEEPGEKEAPPAKPKPAPAAKSSPAPAPARPGPTTGSRENTIPRSASSSDDSLGRALVALSAAMLAWGGVVAKTEADVCAWIKRFENFRTKGVVPEIEK